MDKVSFSGSKISLISRFEWIISARASCCKRKLFWLLHLFSKKTVHSGIELISEFPKEWLIITKIFFLQSFLLFLLESLKKICLAVFCAWMLEQFSPTSKGYWYHLFLSHRLYTAKIKYTRSFDDYVYVLRTTKTRHMVSFIDFYFHFPANFQT